MKVLWLTFIPSPYRCSFFEELSKNCELTVLFERAKSNLRGNNWDDFQFKGYKGKILPGVTIGGHDRLCFSVRSYLLDKSFDIIVISNPTSPTGIYAAAILKSHNIPYVVESDGAFPTNKTGLKMQIKKFVMASAEICLSTAKLHDEYYIECGVKKERIFRYPFTSLSNDDLLDINTVSHCEKIALRKKLLMNEEKIVLSVGQFIHRKGFDILMRSVKGLNNVGVYIVGGLATEEYIRMKNELQLNNVHFVGFKDKKDLQEYYKASDIFVLPTREDVWGLVINEAMGFGLPIITTDKCIAGVELVKEGKNGYLVAVDDVENLSRSIKKILSLDSESYEQMRLQSQSIIEKYTYEEMAKVHMQIFETLL